MSGVAHIRHSRLSSHTCLKPCVDLPSQPCRPPHTPVCILTANQPTTWLCVCVPCVLLPNAQPNSCVCVPCAPPTQHPTQHPPTPRCTQALRARRASSSRSVTWCSWVTTRSLRWSLSARHQTQVSGCVCMCVGGGAGKGGVRGVFGGAGRGRERGVLGVCGKGGSEGCVGGVLGRGGEGYLLAHRSHLGAEIKAGGGRVGAGWGLRLDPQSEVS